MKFVQITQVETNQQPAQLVLINIDYIITIAPSEFIINSEVIHVWLITVNLGPAVTTYATKFLPSPLAELLPS